MPKRIRPKASPPVSSGVRLWEHAKQIIPGGNQLLSKRPDRFLPDQWPTYYKRARGITIWDLDGRQYQDFCIMGVGACILGYADPTVNAAVKRAVNQGSMSTLNAPEEIELAELLCALHPWAGMVRYARTGGESMAIAVRIGRAFSGKDRVAICGYHGWSDWYLATNLARPDGLSGHLLSGLEPRGVPSVLSGTTLPFAYNKLAELEQLVAQYPDIGVIVVEPLRHQEPENNFLAEVKKIAERVGAVLIFDEITIGWRTIVGGVHLRYGVEPDIAVFGKAMANGFAMGAIIGRTEVMQAAQQTFISSTFWTERIGPVAALATVKKLRRLKAPQHIKKIGILIGDGWRHLAIKHDLKLKVLGPPALVTFEFEYENGKAVQTLFTQEMLSRGYLASASVYVSCAHTVPAVRRYLRAVDEVFGILKKAVAESSVLEQLRGPVAYSGFKRLT